MFAKFFIERPIFAWVVSIGHPADRRRGGLHAADRPVSRHHAARPLQVIAMYPGASAKVIADSVAAPIEQQVNGVEHMLYMSSQCTNDGAYNLTITFDLGTDLNMAQVLVQNRVALALPQLPSRGTGAGRQRRRRSRPASCWCVNLISPDGRYDGHLPVELRHDPDPKDELARIYGVGDIDLSRPTRLQHARLA